MQEIWLANAILINIQFHISLKLFSSNLLMKNILGKSILLSDTQNIIKLNIDSKIPITW